MEHKEISNLLTDDDSRVVIREWNIAKDQLKTSYSVQNKVIYNTIDI